MQIQGTDPESPVLDADKHIDVNGFVRDLSASDIFREMTLDVDFGEEECIPEEPFAYSDIEKFVEHIESYARPPLPWKANHKPINGRPPLSHFGNKYSGLLPQLLDIALTARLDKFYQRSLRCKIVQEAIEDLGVQYVNFKRPTSRFSSRFLNWEIENELIKLIWQKTQSASYKERLRFSRMRAEKNYASGEKFIDDAFSIYAKLLVVRLDLGFKKDIRGNLSLEDVRGYFKKFLNLKRRKGSKDVFEHSIGYIRKLEHKSRKGHHYHLMMFFNGQHVKDDYDYASELGKFWVETVTEGKGVFHNCNANKFGYRRCGTGLIGHMETTKRAVLTKLAMGYLAKSDELCKPAADKIRRFQRSLVKPRKSAASHPRNAKILPI
ncbi:hypothetical protein J2W26_006741 [Variovorax boronicumulans]|uniref:YagK/YfjJ domain-containing protein n=1 Tax=Variovorax boronicumulans TaxID=436515 RepID=UPI002790B39E|nr:inovirus-type Gp2 protein [Variovorax boronicumulans]MDP9882403.1 hypothetical protein [Variovorax boronicumulans]